MQLLASGVMLSWTINDTALTCTLEVSRVAWYGIVVHLHRQHFGRRTLLMLLIQFGADPKQNAGFASLLMLSMS